MKQMKRIAATLALLTGFALSCTRETPTVFEQRDIALKAVYSGTSVPMAWSSGDQIRLYSQNGKHLSGQNTLTTDDGFTFKESAYLEIAPEYWFVSPSSAATGATPDRIYAKIPSVQPAVAGGVSSSSAVSVGVSGTIDGSVTLSPAAAFIKFTPEGSVVPDVTQVTIDAPAGYLSGDIIITNPGKPAVEADLYRNVQVPSGKVILQGTFESGSTYYVAIVPGTLDKGLTLSMVDDIGNGNIVIIDRPVTAAAGEVIDLGIINMGDHFEGNLNVTQIMKASKGVKPITLIFAPEGFVEGSGLNSREEFEQASKYGAERIFNTEPYKSMKEYFNVYIAWKASSTSDVGGTFNVKEGLDYDNYWGLASTDRPAVYNWAKSIVPDWRDGVTNVDDGGIFLIINGRDYYGSVCWWEDSGRFIALTNYSPDYVWSSGYTRPGEELHNFGGEGYYVRTESGDDIWHQMTDEEYQALGYRKLWSGGSWVFTDDWTCTLIHEGCGHGFGRLQDEYWTGYTNVYSGAGIQGDYEMNPPRALNLAYSTTEYPWKKFEKIAKEEYAPLDARYDRIGLWQGGMVRYERGIWRSEIIDCMKDTRPYWSAWNRAVIYQRIMRTSGEDPDFNVVENENDIRTFLDHDIAVGGAYDPVRGE